MSTETPLPKPVLLGRSHDLSGFDCGAPSLNEYLHKYAWQNHQNRSARTYITARDNRVAGYRKYGFVSAPIDEFHLYLLIKDIKASQEGDCGSTNMGTATRTRDYTFDDFCLLVKDGQKADLIDGVIYMASPDNTDANDLFLWLVRLLADVVDMNDLGKVNGARVAYRLNNKNSPEPDVAFIRRDRTNLVRRGFVNGPPDLAMEIVSPESVERDYEAKRELYQEAGVEEYWIVDEVKQVVTLLRLAPNGKYREVRPKKGELHSQVVPGFWIRPE